MEERDPQLIMRLPTEQQDRLRAYAAQLTEEFGIPVSMAACARRLINEGLERAGHGRSSQAGSAAARKKAPAKKRPRKRREAEP